MLFWLTKTKNFLVEVLSQTKKDRVNYLVKGHQELACNQVLRWRIIKLSQKLQNRTESPNFSPLLKNSVASQKLQNRTEPPNFSSPALGLLKKSVATRD